MLEERLGIPGWKEAQNNVGCPATLSAWLFLQLLRVLGGENIHWLLSNCL